MKGVWCRAEEGGEGSEVGGKDLVGRLGIEEVEGVSKVGEIGSELTFEELEGIFEELEYSTGILTIEQSLFKSKWWGRGSIGWWQWKRSTSSLVEVGRSDKGTHEFLEEGRSLQDTKYL